MKPTRILGSSRGSVHFALIFIVIVTLGVLHGVSLKRSTLAMKMVKGRYWSAAAFDLAENGVEFERMLLSTGAAAAPGRPPETHSRSLDKFAGYEGLFESSAAALEDGAYEIVSTGKLLDHKGEVRYAVRIDARIRPDSRGVWKTIRWTEKTTKGM